MTGIKIKNPAEIRTMAEGGKILAGIIGELEKMVRPGIVTQELNRVAETLILKSGGECSFKDYGGFPACLCASVNNEIVHGVPSGRILKEGDILSLDLGIFYKGFHSDMAVTVPVGDIGPEARRIIMITKESLNVGIREAKAGNHIGDIGYAIQKYVESQGFNVVRELCGHGIGRDLHEDPQIVNYGEKGSGLELSEGTVFCIEPMVTAGDWHLKKSADNFGFETKDGSLSCHFEHTVAITKNDCRILTK